MITAQTRLGLREEGAVPRDHGAVRAAETTHCGGTPSSARTVVRRVTDRRCARALQRGRRKGSCRAGRIPQTLGRVVYSSIYARAFIKGSSRRYFIPSYMFLNSVPQFSKSDEFATLM